MSSSNLALPVYKRLLTYVWPYRWVFLLAILGNALYGVADGALIKFLQPLLNKGFVAHDVTFIRWLPLMLVSIFVLRGLATFLATYCMGWVGRRVVMDLRQGIFQHLLHLPATYFDNTSSGEILGKITYNVEQVADASIEAFTTLIRESCTALGFLMVMLSISWQLTLCFFIVIPLIAGILSVVSKKMRSISHHIQRSVGDVTQVAEEAIQGQKMIKAFGAQIYETQRFKEATQFNRRQEMKLITTSSISISLIQLIGAGVMAMAMYLIMLDSSLIKIELTPGAFAAMMAAMFALLKPIKQLTKVNGNLQKGIANAISIFNFLDTQSEKDEGQENLKKAQGKISFNRINFNYPSLINKDSKKVLDEISFEVKPGETIALVGRSGSGKSTLVNLLPRFYETQGEIQIDGINIQSFSLKNLRQQIAVVSQQVILFNATIAQNIAYGMDKPIDEIIEAAKQSFAYEFIQQLPQGFDTLIGENGIRLSGGQRQRLAIARAILKKAPILILDEATSALDSESERYIQRALDLLSAQCTTLVIAHRLSTLEKANRIIVLDNGKITEMGTHSELMLQNGLYATLYHLQYNSSSVNS